jgi:glutaminase
LNFGNSKTLFSV